MIRRKEIGGRRKEVGRRTKKLHLSIVAFILLSPSSFLLPPGFSQDPPLPDSDTFLRTVRDNLIRAERINHLYAYKERRTDVHTNPFGRLGTEGTSLFEVYPSVIRSLTYRRLIERNGTPVNARELAAQDGEYRARVAEVQREARGSGNAEQVLEEQDAAARRRGQRAVEDVANTFAFRLERREVYEGVRTIVVSFAPKPRVSMATRQGRIAQKFAGTIWVAEDAAEVMRLEAKSIDNISIGYGIVARLSEGTTATVTRRPVEENLWMPVELTLTGRGRAAFFLRRLNVDFRLEWFDYRRLPDNVLAPFLDARVHGEAGRRP